jgi:uncharacterized protein (DUF1697 family)
MQKYISILRGINVGGNRKVLMADLKAIYEALGFTDIVTYIQSGNVVFNAPKQSTETITENIKNAILDKTGFEVPVIIRTAEEFQQIVTTNPFLEKAGEDLSKLHVTFLGSIPEPELVKQLEELKFDQDEFKILGDKVFIFCVTGYGKTKINNNFFEKKLKTSATTRNWKTVGKLLELSNNK